MFFPFRAVTVEFVAGGVCVFTVCPCSELTHLNINNRHIDAHTQPQLEHLGTRSTAGIQPSPTHLSARVQRERELTTGKARTPKKKKSLEEEEEER